MLHHAPSTLPGLHSTTIADCIARWPADIPLVCAVSSGPLNEWNRYSVFGLPTARLSHDTSDHRTTLVPVGESSPLPFDPTHDPLADLDAALTSTLRKSDSPSEHPFAGGWIGTLSYELGRTIEPRAAHTTGSRPSDRAWPLYTLYRCPAALVHDRLTDTWTPVGETDRLSATPTNAPTQPFVCGPFTSATGRAKYQRAVDRAVEYTHAGDIYQANIAHRLTAPFTGSPRAAFARTIDRTEPWFGAYIETLDHDHRPARAIASASPELFLRLDASGQILTRPIKGTLRADRDAGSLMSSSKDAAELAMIVDLMRNDLGRVCAPGTVAVRAARELEQHAPASPIHHTSATVAGTLRAGVSRTDVLRAAFPPGSITGAPKVRAMQIIDELEPVARGPYTGSAALFCDTSAMSLSVAIRTGAFTRTADDRYTLDVHAGAGIVADSDPASEWRETLDKARAYARSLGTTIEGDE